MPAAEKPANEAARLDALGHYRLLDTLPEAVYDNITKLASIICETPIALISLVDADRQWFKSRHGIDAEQTHRDLAFCAHAILDPDDILLVEDATKDPRFADNDLVLKDPEIRFYAGCPLNTPSGHSIGTLCVIDQKPKTLSTAQQEALRTLACNVIEWFEQRSLQEKLAEQSHYLQMAEKVAGVGHWCVDLKDNTVFWSDEIYRIHGVTPETYTPELESAIQFYHPDDQEYVNATVQTAIEKGEGFSFELRLVRPDGEIRHVASKGEVVANTDNQAIFGVFQDITERKDAQRELEASEAFQELIMENNPDMVFVKNEKCEIVEANPAFLAAYPDHMQDKIIGYTTVEEYREEEREGFLAKDREAFENGLSETIEHINFPNGEAKTLFTKKIRFKNAVGESFILGIARDITAMAEAERQREQLVEQLTESNEELERFAYVASHDLQEPLRMVRNFTELLKQQYSNQLDDQAIKYIDISVDAATRMQELVEDLLEYARVSQDGEKYETVDGEDSVRYVLENLHERIAETGAKITHDPLPSFMGNPVRFSRLLQNIIGNGLKYQPEGAQPEVHIAVTEQDDMWQFAVADNGIGIKSEHCEQIFQPFKRLHGKSEYAGTGMGLAICRKIIENMGGRIWVEPNAKSGSTFFFTIPKQQPATS